MRYIVGFLIGVFVFIVINAIGLVLVVWRFKILPYTFMSPEETWELILDASEFLD
jgi:hypothetical protein